MIAIVGSVLRALRIIRSSGGRHRLDQQPVHAGYVGTAGPAAELAEQPGRHAA